MTQIEAIFIIGISALAMWQRDFFLYLGITAALVLYGFQFAETSWTEAIPVLILAAYMAYRSIKYWFD
jgi:hypothetical protein